jgi:hypothetical protein
MRISCNDDPGANGPNYAYTDAFDEGEQANADGFASTENPYEASSDEGRGWNDGWLTGQDAREEWEAANHERAKASA